jgi:hypothetical protein
MNIEIYLKTAGIDQSVILDRLYAAGILISKGTLSKIVAGKQKSLPKSLGEAIAAAIGESPDLFFYTEYNSKRARDPRWGVK